MARQARLQQLRASLVRGLALAREGQGWQTLVQAEAALARELPVLARAGHWTQAERPHWTRLCEVHAEARAACEDAMVDLQDRLQTLAEQREGWLAYALTSLQDPLEAQP